MSTKNHSDEKLVSQVCEALDDSLKRIDAETSQRIVAARQAALAKTPKRFSMPKVFIATATAFSLLLAVFIVKTQLNQNLENESIEAIELIASQETIDLYEELEFYTWLVEEDVTS